MQNYEIRKEGSKRVIWDELVHVWNIEPCPGNGRGKWHHPELEHSQRQEHHWEDKKQTNYTNSVTSPICEL
jgi:hypothetical protein